MAFILGDGGSIFSGSSLSKDDRPRPGDLAPKVLDSDEYLAPLGEIFSETFREWPQVRRLWSTEVRLSTLELLETLPERNLNLSQREGLRELDSLRLRVLAERAWDLCRCRPRPIFLKSCVIGGRELEYDGRGEA